MKLVRSHEGCLFLIWSALRWLRTRATVNIPLPVVEEPQKLSPTTLYTLREPAARFLLSSKAPIIVECVGHAWGVVPARDGSWETTVLLFTSRNAQISRRAQAPISSVKHFLSPLQPLLTTTNHPHLTSLTFNGPYQANRSVRCPFSLSLVSMTLADDDCFLHLRLIASPPVARLLVSSSPARAPRLPRRLQCVALSYQHLYRLTS